jgi:hypothetical protein
MEKRKKRKSRGGGLGDFVVGGTCPRGRKVGPAVFATEADAKAGLKTMKKNFPGCDLDIKSTH